MINSTYDVLLEKRHFTLSLQSLSNTAKFYSLEIKETKISRNAMTYLKAMFLEKVGE